MKTELFPHLETIGEPESDTATIERFDAIEDNFAKAGNGYRVLLYNDDHTEVDDVIKQIIKATQCSVDKAVQIMLEAHHKGRAICYRGAREKCQKVALVLREIRLQCEVDCD
ncbi:ATP-dependent Clp protease adaptor protein ClpS [Abditibacterium utsteinense]|uniref:ATP-dependent Clp protease adaptor protein ClpS n=1 Tax=Abditibacterium utsteinense TaxID=1960156 RepID=A0A2S8SV14_9BACT|nr:ATP-dependent Clp protease adaptor ClpS [Abditibacterium utsteinense]PQV64633.1 ATP-dependent Clp protease adaptor protein ClpS [Abditibacterium utsteinense]